MSLKWTLISLQALPHSQAHSVAYNICTAPSVLITSPLDSQTQSSPGYLPISVSGLPRHFLFYSFASMKKTFLKTVLRPFVFSLSSLPWQPYFISRFHLLF